jgi:predicted HAD superfamily Cof-like phosphohydrolase
MEAQQQRVKQFMELFGQECPDKPNVLDETTAKLRATLILEEALETITKGLGLEVIFAQKNGIDEVFVNEENLLNIEFSFEKLKEVDLVELADGISDISIVTYGTAVAAGIDMETIDREVSDSNMSKLWKEEDFEEGKQLYPTANVEKYYGSLYCLKREDGKVIKSPSYKPAQIAPLIKAQQ